MIELRETYKKHGIEAVIWGLASAHVQIKPAGIAGHDDYWVITARTHNGETLKGSTRHNLFHSYNAAVEYVLGYAERVSKQKREKDAKAARAAKPRPPTRDMSHLPISRESVKATIAALKNEPSNG